MIKDSKKPDNSLLWKYAGFATQLIIALGLAVWLGIKIDGWLKINAPIAVWVLPLLIIIVLIVKAIKDTSPKK
jgi:chromate transport protein ChrA